MNLYSLPDNELARKVQSLYKEARSKHNQWRDDAEEDFNFVSGKQWDKEDEDKLKGEGRPIITYNRCNAIISAILGLEANQRMETRFTPRETSDNKIADAVTQAVDWVREYATMESEESMAFEHQLICGMGWNEILMDFETDLDGKICQENVSPFDMEWDWTARKRNLVDAEWVDHAKGMSREKINEQWPEAEVPDEDFETYEETKAVNVTAGDRYNEKDNTGSSGSKLPKVHRFQWFEGAVVYRIQDPQTGRIVEVSQEKYDTFKDVVEKANAPVLKQRKRVYYEAYVLGNTLLEKALSPCQTGFNFKCDTGKHDEIANTWYGIIRLMKDPQRWSNKFLSTFIDIIDANAKGGLIAETGAFLDQRKAEEDWAKTNSIVFMQNGAVANKRVMPKPTPAYPQGTDNLLKFSISSIYDVAGVNLELLGMADRAQPGMVEESRKKSAYTILAPYFDSHRMFKKYVGLTLLEYVKNYIPAERIAAALQGELASYAPLIKQLDLAQTNVVVSESPQSDNNKAMSWIFIQNILPAMLKMGVPIPPEILDYSPLPGVIVDKWKAMLDPKNKEGQAQQQMQVMQQQMQQMQQALQQFQQENVKLKSQEQSRLAELSMKKDYDEAELMLQQDKIRGEFALRREQLDNDFKIEIAKARMQMDVDAMKHSSEMDAKMQMHGMEMAKDVAVAKMQPEEGQA